MSGEHVGEGREQCLARPATWAEDVDGGSPDEPAGDNENVIRDIGMEVG
jgi:hypothetical protein